MSDTSATNIVKKSVGFSVALSVLMIVAGVLAIALPRVAGFAVNIFVGWALVFVGVMHLIFAWSMRTAGGIFWQLLLGILDIFIGGYLLLRPVSGLATLTLALAIYLFIRGVFEIILSFQIRAVRGSGWLMFDGFILLILGFMIWRTWPWSTEWAIGILVGVSMIFSGFTRLMVSMAARHVVNKMA